MAKSWAKARFKNKEDAAKLAIRCLRDFDSVSLISVEGEVLELQLKLEKLPKYIMEAMRDSVEFDLHYKKEQENSDMLDENKKEEIPPPIPDENKQMGKPLPISDTNSEERRPIVLGVKKEWREIAEQPERNW